MGRSPMQRRVARSNSSRRFQSVAWTSTLRPASSANASGNGVWPLWYFPRSSASTASPVASDQTRPALVYVERRAELELDWRVVERERLGADPRRRAADHPEFARVPVALGFNVREAGRADPDEHARRLGRLGTLGLADHRVLPPLGREQAAVVGLDVGEQVRANLSGALGLRVVTLEGSHRRKLPAAAVAVDDIASALGPGEDDCVRPFTSAMDSLRAAGASETSSHSSILPRCRSPSPCVGTCAAPAGSRG
jgi:hypothetical protein